MKVSMILVLLMGLSASGMGQERWKKESIHPAFPLCYASNESHESYVGPPREYYDRLKSASALQTNIEVTYVGFSSQAQAAFQYAVDIWKTLIYSPVPIRMKATWESLESGVLGSCGPTAYYKNFNSTQLWNCFYPVSIVEKMLGEEVNSPDQYDLEASFNKDFSNWYLGTDGNTPSRQYDFVSVVLHELTHGLGFTGLLYSDNGKGAYSYGGESYAGIFDQYIINQRGEQLVNKSIFSDPSIKLHQAMTSGWLAFNSSLTAGQLPRLYAPATWDDGSSLYHLNDVNYPSGDPNSLMTPSTGTGEAIHSPGPLSLAMMYDIGWKTVSIHHEPLKDIEFASAPLDFEANIVSDYALDRSKVYLIYSANRFTKKDSVLLKETDLAGNYTAQLSQFKTGEVSYYFTATDINQRRFVFPANAPARYLSFKIGVDNVVPFVQHEPVKYLISSNPSAMIQAEVIDNLGLKSVNIEYFVNGGLIKKIPMLETGGDMYAGNFVFPEGTVKGGDEISYRISAVDASLQGNIGKSPLTGYYSFKVEKIEAPANQYVNNFNSTSNDFIGSDFTVSTPTGFDSPALNSAHPYLSPDADDQQYNFTSILRKPIILKAGGKMSFDEIVLVEPGEPGASFGDDEFWDYVIVEGSTDGGNSWKPLMDGYDSNAQQSWYNLFTRSTSENNSTGVPNRDLLVKHEFDLLASGNFNPGEIILVRFRLFSDPYSNGWGWLIDNVNIQDIETDAHWLTISSREVTFYPNPATERLNIQFQTRNLLGKLAVKAYNSLGTMVYNQPMSIGSNDYLADIDVSGFIPGLYLFVVEPENGELVSRKIVVQ